MGTTESPTDAEGTTRHLPWPGIEADREFGGLISEKVDELLARAAHLSYCLAALPHLDPRNREAEHFADHARRWYEVALGRRVSPQIDPLGFWDE